MGHVRTIVGRVHVATDYLEVCRYVISCLKGGYKGFRKLPTATRREILRVALSQHAANRAFYNSVVRGGF